VSCRLAVSDARLALANFDNITIRITNIAPRLSEAVGLTKVVPFLVEDEMMKLGATFSKVKDWGVHTVADGQLITGQNPASSGSAAKLLIDTLNKKAK
jgi:putative intracellular protease/amidase